MDGYTPIPEEESHTGLILLIVFIVIVIAVGIAIYYFYILPSRPTARGTTWNIITGGTGTSDSFNAAAGNAYLVSSTATGTFQLTLVPPTNARGQEFAVIHGGAATVAMSISGGVPYNLQPRTSQTFVWLSQAEFSLI